MHNNAFIDFALDNNFVDPIDLSQVALFVVFSFLLHVLQVGRGKLLKLYKLFLIDDFDDESLVMCLGKGRVALAS